MAASHRAFTLIELTIVVLILGIMASALGAGPPTAESQQKVDLTAETVAMTLRFARSEALRAGEERIAAVVPSSGRVFAAQPNLSGGNVASGPVLENPLDKRAYDFVIGELEGAYGVELESTNDPFSFQGLGTAQNTIVFDSMGMPYFLQGGSRYPLASGWLKLVHGSAERSITVSSAGRVMVR